MKFIIEYGTGEYDDWGMHYYAVEYDSKEDVIADIKKGYAEWVQKDKKNRIERAKWLKNHYYKYENIDQSFIKLKDGNITSFDKNYGASDKIKYKLFMPDIYTLDEWFETRRPYNETD